MVEIDKIEIERIINLKKTNTYDVKSMENIFETYMNQKINICGHCAAQIRMAQKQISNWYNQINNLPPVQEEIKPKGCQACKKRGRPKK